MIIEAMNAWRLTEKEVGVRGYHATPMSRYAYKLNLSERDKLRFLIWKIGVVLMMIATPSLGILAKKYPKETQIMFIALVYTSPVIYWCIKHRIVRNKERILIWPKWQLIYSKHLALQLSNKYLLKQVCMIIAGIAFFIITVPLLKEKGYSVFASAIVIPIILFFLCSMLYHIYLLWLKHTKV